MTGVKSNLYMGVIIMKNFIIVVAVFFVLCAVVGSCSDSSDSKYNGYSDSYNNDEEYRDDVGEIADAFGVSDQEVDEKINAVVDSLQ